MKNFCERMLQNMYYPFRVFTALAINFLIGILAATFVQVNFIASWPVFVTTIFALVFCATVNFILRNQFLVLASFGACALVLGLFYYSYFDSKSYVALPWDREVETAGQVAKRPEIDYKKQKLVIKWSKANSGLEKDSYILVNAPHFPEFRYGDFVKIKGKLEEPQNFNDFDYKSYLKRYHIYGVVNTSEIILTSESKSLAVKLMQGLYGTSRMFEQSLGRILPEPHASLASGILLGVKKNIPDGLMTQLQDTGLTHIIALSGFNVTILIAILADLLIIYLGRRGTFYAGFLLVMIFVLMTGASPSIVRAALFSMLILFSKIVGRQPDNTNLMLLAAVIMVLINPYILRFDLGFQLSFLAFAGLIYLSPSIEKIFSKLRAKLPRFVTTALSETLGAQFATMPLIFFTFGKISLIAPIANIMIVWIIPWIMLLSFVSGLMGMFYLPLGRILALVAWPLVEFVIKMVDLLGNLPLSSINLK